ALLIQKETGGNLAEILDGLARVIRDRFRIYREVKVRTAQGRLTASILIALPIFMMIVLTVMNPSYMRVLYEDPRGPMILTVAAGMQSSARFCCGRSSTSKCDVQGVGRCFGPSPRSRSLPRLLLWLRCSTR